MAGRRTQVKILLCFRLRLVLPLHLALARFGERRKHYRGGGLPYHISYVDLLAVLPDVAVQFNALHAACDVSVHNGSAAGTQRHASAHNGSVAGNQAPRK